MVTPSAAPNPVAPNANARNASRGPNPPMLTGIAITTSAANASGTRSPSGAGTPAVRAATRNNVTCPAVVAAEYRTTRAVSTSLARRDRPSAKAPAISPAINTGRSGIPGTSTGHSARATTAETTSTT